MAENVFVKAKAYQKRHPRTAWQDCIKAVSGKKAKVGTVKRTKSAPAAKVPKKIKVKIKPGKKGSSMITISGIALNKVTQEHKHQEGLTVAINRHKAMLKVKGLTPGEKAQIRRDIANYGKLLKTSKQAVTALKRSI